MTWSTTEIQYQGFPLLLRKPEYTNIWDWKDKLIKLVCVEHFLDQTYANGLPDKQYNLTLSAFDEHMCSLFDESNDGIILLIETYAGKRLYYYYTVPGFTMNLLIKKAKQKFKVKLESWFKNDIGWGFLNKYPVTIFSK